jgi:tetratricopeptide (TPR) repeat protein
MFRAYAPAFALALVTLPAQPASARTCDDREVAYEARIPLCDQAYAAATDPDAAASALGYKAEAQRLLGQFDEATATLQQALRLAPQNPWYWVELGSVHFDQGDAAGAVAHYSTAIELDPADSYARLNRADAWWQLNAPDRCLTDSTVALQTSPDDVWAALVQGRCLTDLGRAEQALPLIDRAIDSDPAWPAPRLARVTALLALGRASDALAEAEAGLLAIPSDAVLAVEGLQSLGLAAMARSQPAEAALAEADRLAVDYPDNLAIPAVKVWVLTRAARLDEAEVAATPLRAAAAAASPEMRGTLHDALGQLDLARGDTESATRHFTRAMALDPSLARVYTRALSELGFLPLSSARHNVAMALQRCLAAKGAECRVGS